MKLQLALCGLLSGVTSSAAFDVNALDAAILHDLLHSYTDNQPSTCTGAEGSTSFSFDWPGQNAASEWYPDFQGFEEDLFLAAMSHTDPNGRSWTIRIGQGGNMYSHFVPDMHGETMPPQAHTDAPWIDEVHQSVSVNNYLNFGAGRCNGQNCPANFVHGAGTYQRDDPYTNVPFFSQSVAKYCSGDSCIFAAWGQQAHLATIFTSSVMTFNKFTNCGNGIIEHTQMIHNFAPANTVAPELVDQTYFNTPWSGVRRSKLPYALEPDYANGTLSYDDPDTVDYCPLCGWGNDAPGGPQDMGNGRCARAYNQNTGGYTTFAAPGLFVNRETSLQQYLWCRKPDADCALNPSTCMARPTECYNEDGSPKTGYTPIQLQVNANSTPQCKGHIGLFEGYMTVQCKFHTTGFGNCGTYLYAGTSSDTCAPWLSGGTMGMFREDTNEGMTIPYVRHWSWSASNQFMYFSVYSQDQTEAINMVNSMFDNTGNPNPLPIRFETFPPGETFPGANYNPGALDSVTFVYGKDSYSATPGSGRRRMGSSSRDYTVFTINWMQSGAKLTPGDTYSNRSFMFASDLASAKPTADSLLPSVVPDKIFDTRWNPRAIDIYKSGTSFDAVAASSVEGTTTTCSSTTANLECSGYSTPKAGYVPFFHVTCGASSYLGPDPYHFTPGNGDWFTFPGMSNDNTKKIRSYACVGEVESVRPTWKLIGWFDPTSCSSLGAGLVFDDNICTAVAPTPPPTAQPSANPTPVPTGQPVTADPTPAPTSPPSASPTPVPTADPTPLPTANPTPGPTPLPSANPTPPPTGQPVTADPTPAPTSPPSASPTPVPTADPTPPPTANPTAGPTPLPSANPTPVPTADPTPPPTANPTPVPTADPTPPPTANPTPAPTDPVQQTVFKHVCAKNAPDPTIICADGEVSGGSCPNENVADGCGNGGKVCWWAECVIAPATPPPTAVPTNPPAPTTSSPTTTPPAPTTSSPTTTPPAPTTPSPTETPPATVEKYVCAKNPPDPTIICADGTVSDATCPTENVNDGCGNGGKVCWWASCPGDGGGPTPPTASPPPTPAPVDSPTGGCPVCLSTGEPCCDTCIDGGKPSERGCFP